MGKVAIHDNYRVTIDGVESTFYAVSNRQAWYQSYELADGDLIEGLEKIDEQGDVVEVLMEKEE